MRRIIQAGGFFAFAGLAAACSSSDGGDDTANQPVEPGPDNPKGLPACGDDPESQPDICIDAKGAERCRVDSGFPGDELALCEPDPEEGMLIHFGPQNYDDPADVANFVLEPSGEEEFCMYARTTNATEKFFNRYHGRLRPNSHHLIVTMPAAQEEPDTAPWKCGPQVFDRWLFGSQDPTIDVQNAKDTVEGDPDYGVAHDLPPNQTLLLDFHNVNPTGTDMLREAWAVIKYIDEEDVLIKSDLIGFYALDINIPPLAKSITRKTCTAPTDLAGNGQPVYLSVATVHAHERLVRGSLWHNKADGTSELIYESTDWAEPGNAEYTRGEPNPPLPLKPGQAWGAKNDYVQVMPGESMTFECEFQNNLNETVRFGETTNQEMCNIFGLYYPTLGGMWNCL